MSHQRNSRGGFTLIELLVVVSIIALLISILLPAVGTARQRARVNVCTQNQRQHGVGVNTYAAANDDRLPNAPDAPRLANQNQTTSPYGIPGRPARQFGDIGFPIGGFAFPNQGIQTHLPILGNDGMYSGSVAGLPHASSWAFLNMYNGYWTVLGPYMVERDGIDTLEDIFYCPSQRSGRENRETVIKPYLRNNDGVWPALNRGSQAASFQTGSYRYVPTAIMNANLWSFDSDGNAIDGSFDPLNQSLSKANIEEFAQQIRRNQMARVKYPSSKVLFFLDYASHNKDVFYWFEQGAICTVALGDGSAQTVQPFRDVPLANIESIRDNFGPVDNLIFTGQSSDIVYPGAFIGTAGGIGGRDIP